MTNGEDRLDRVERILEETARRQQQRDEEWSRRQQQRDEEWSRRQQQLGEEWSQQIQRVNKILEEMAARQRYHDEAHERHDAAIKTLIEAVRADGENIRALARIAEAHQRRLDDLDGGAA